MSADKQAQLVDPDPSYRTRVPQQDTSAAGVQATLGAADPEIDGEQHPTFDGLVDVRPDSEGVKYHLQRCPLCPGTVLLDGDSVDNHIATHDPADFGLDGEYSGIAPQLQYDDPKAVFGGGEQ